MLIRDGCSSFLTLYNYRQAFHKAITVIMSGADNVTNEAIGNPLSTTSQVLETGAAAVQVTNPIFSANSTPFLNVPDD